MDDARFIWDDRKERGNRRKHGVSFAEAVAVFEDPKAVAFPDDEHAEEEDRWIIVGLSQRLGILLVVYVERGENIRLISARKASRKEREIYEEGDTFP